MRSSSAPAQPLSSIQTLEELNRLKTVLLNTAAHELSTPLTPIQLQLTLLQNARLGPLTDQQRESIGILVRNVERLSQLIKDLLDVADIEANRLPANRQPMDLSRAAAEAVQAAEPVAKGAQLHLELDSNHELPILADPRRISQVFQALLSNAIKFTPAGGHIRVRTRPQEGVAVAEIEDSGIGLKPEDFQALFQPFGQAFNTMDMTRSGAGLGLAISQGIVEQLSGRIWCDSAGAGKGTTFAFAIPLRDTRPEGGAAVLQRLAATKGKEVVVKRRGGFLYFKCPACRSRDIQIRVIKNKYDCNRCGHVWR